VALIERFHARGVPVAQVYGSTETGPVSIALRPEEATAHPGRVGRPAPGVTIGLVSPDTGREVQPGEVGEVWVRGANVMRGHLFPADATDFIDGWFRSGDLGRVDERGMYEIVGRSKDMIISGGENIYPAEIENLVVAFEGVADCAVVGVPDARWGEVPVLAVVARSGCALDPAALGAQLEGRLARFKQPKRIVVLPDLPRTALGKVIKPELAAQLAAH
jgi:fatty-acyl-CoA synthase